MLNSIIHGDCLEVMRTFPSESVDLVITSPPYNLGKQKKDKWKSHAFTYKDYDDNLPDDLYVLWQKEVLSECFRLLKPTGAIFYNHKPRIQKGLLNPRINLVDHLPLRQIIIWLRDGGHNHDPSFFTPVCEYIFLICKKGFKLKPGFCVYSDVWAVSQRHKTDGLHPCAFPEEIPRRCILSALYNQVVLDPFCGSGTTCAVAKSLGCDYIGIDISADYCAVAEKRCKSITEFFGIQNPKLF